MEIEITWSDSEILALQSFATAALVWTPLFGEPELMIDIVQTNEILINFTQLPSQCNP